MKELVEASERLLDELCARFPMGYRPVLVWKGLRVSAGMAYTRSGRIALSNRVIQDKDTMRETLIHEYAHLLAVHRHGPKAANHGPGWQQAMRDLGALPRVRHDLPVERNAKRQEVIYRCAKCGIEFAKRRRLPKGRRYLHVRCGGAIRFVAVRAITEPPPAT